MMLRWIFFILLVLGFIWYSSLAIKTITKNPWLYYGYIFLNLIIILNFVVQIIFKNYSSYFFYSLGLVLVTSVFQISIILFLILEDFIRLPLWIYNLINKGTENPISFIPQRENFPLPTFYFTS